MTHTSTAGAPALPVDERFEHWAILTDANMLRMALDEAAARYGRLEEQRVPNRRILFTCVRVVADGDDYVAESSRWIRGTRAVADKPYDNYALGKLATTMHIEDGSHEAASKTSVLDTLNSPEKLAEREGVVALDWRGAAFRAAAYRRESDGVGLSVKVGAGSSGGQGAVDEAVSAEAADHYIMLWLLRAKARDILGMSARG